MKGLWRAGITWVICPAGYLLLSVTLDLSCPGEAAHAFDRNMPKNKVSARPNKKSTLRDLLQHRYAVAIHGLLGQCQSHTREQDLPPDLARLVPAGLLHRSVGHLVRASVELQR